MPWRIAAFLLAGIAYVLGTHWLALDIKGYGIHGTWEPDTIGRQESAVDAAGAIHSDLARGFIRAQVVSYDDFMANDQSLPKCREKGVLRLEGKDYIVADGDMIEIRFNV